MVTLTDPQVKVQSEILEFFKKDHQLTCVPLGNERITLLTFSIPTRGWFWGSNKEALTIFFQYAVKDSPSTANPAKIGLIIYDALKFEGFNREILAIIKKHFPNTQITREKDIPQGAML